MSLIQGGRLVLSLGGNGHEEQPAHRVLPYLGPVGTIPLSVSAGAIHHHPGSDPARARPGEGAGGTGGGGR